MLPAHGRGCSGSRKSCVLLWALEISTQTFSALHLGFVSGETDKRPKEKYIICKKKSSFHASTSQLPVQGHAVFSVWPGTHEGAIPHRAWTSLQPLLLSDRTDLWKWLSSVSTQVTGLSTWKVSQIRRESSVLEILAVETAHQIFS